MEKMEEIHGSGTGCLSGRFHLHPQTLLVAEFSAEETRMSYNAVNFEDGNSNEEWQMPTKMHSKMKI